MWVLSINLTKACGTFIEVLPSKLFSITAISALPAANADPLIVWAKTLSFPSLSRIFPLLAWKSKKLEHDEISLQTDCGYNEMGLLIMSFYQYILVWV